MWHFSVILYCPAVVFLLDNNVTVYMVTKSATAFSNT